MEVIILRGLLGAGKDHWIKANVPNAVVCSADDYHMIGGVYRYDPKYAGEAHRRCLEKFIDAANIGTFTEDGPAAIVVNNTNTTALEICPYYRVAEALALPVRIVRIHVDFETACRRNVHAVPASTIWAMFQNLYTERLPAWWKEEIAFPKGGE